MPTKSDRVDTKQQQIDYWRARFEKQKLLLSSIVSLLNKYGSCLDRLSLYREFVLTLMGQYLVGDACYFSAVEPSLGLEPVVAYGRLPLVRLRNIKVDERLAEVLRAEKPAQHLDRLPAETYRDENLKRLKDTMQIVSPVYLGEKLAGLLFLGEKISKQGYSAYDLELLHTLCAASAVTFNNANLFENVKSSMNEVQRLSDIRTEMISRISHEFRTPLTTIRASLACLPESVMPEAIAQGLEHSVNRLQTLIETLLELRTEGNTDQNSPPDVFNPAIPIYECISANDDESMSRELTVRIREDPAIGPLCIAISRKDFATIVDKLFENAVRFSNHGSTIVIDLGVLPRGPDEALDGTLIAEWQDQTQKAIGQYRSLIDTTATKPPADRDAISNMLPHLVLRVTDTGIGIPSEELQYLGEPFRQASNSPDRNVKGTALGLAVVRKILADCEGHLCCRSEEGVATTFSVFLPVAR